ncbi:helix-turn-helix domain-containing protein [Fimbriimonas ginsengisoli]|uniref:Transcriptional regulator n=1 Tax=Fimbriimonas ginsengisoli Gsoil 348 TaxID=661478 RepID=A0A068NVJ5_FIMGI|nr:helix-turn-helix transcriptional regulator [Fimbriimonas ginsengisoli]AIE87471.1 transcriptional regulator [Fimbriimonas ginsengisoli Gsoil 348]
MSFELSSGNVFADLGYENAEEMVAKAELVRALTKAIDSKQLSQTKAAQLMGVDQPTLSKLLRGRTRSFSIDRLSHMLTALGRNVTIVIEEPEVESLKEERTAPGHIRVVKAVAGSAPVVLSSG